MKMRSTIFAGVYWPLLKKSLFGDNSEGGGGTKSSGSDMNESFIAAHLYYYPKLQELIDALKSGKDISPRIAFIDIEELHDNSYTYSSGGSSPKSGPDNISNSSGRTLSGDSSPSSNGYEIDLIPYEDVDVPKIYVRNNLAATIYDKVIGVYNKDNSMIIYNIENAVYDAYDEGDILHDRSPYVLGYSDAEDVYDIMMQYMNESGENEPIANNNDGGDKNIAKDELPSNDSSTIAEQMEEELAPYFHSLVAISIAFNGSVQTIWLTDEPAENFKAYQYQDLSL